jgi:serine/threonine-protein kinase
MPLSRLSSLLAFLREKDFLDKRQLEELSREPQFADVPSALRELVRRNWLTGFQANRISKGREAELVLGSYRLLEPIGEGGMGKVFKACHARMNRQVALKVIPSECLANANAVSRFHREMRAVAQLSHANIVSAFDAGQEGETHYLAMEFVEGIDLARLVRQSGPLGIPQACEYIRQAALGLQHAHEKGLVHRDIKPGNLIVSRSGSDGSPVVKILDFGLARFEEHTERMTRLTQLGRILGTVDYISPEQAGDASVVDIRADIYSLGCSLFYLLTGKPPFAGADSMERTLARLLKDAPSVCNFRAEVPAELEQIVARMLARKPKDRYRTPTEVAAALEPFTRPPQPGQESRSLGITATPPTKYASVGVQTESSASIRRRESSIAPWESVMESVAVEVPRNPRRSRNAPLAIGIVLGFSVVAAIAFFALGKYVRAPDPKLRTSDSLTTNKSGGKKARVEAKATKEQPKGDKKAKVEATAINEQPKEVSEWTALFNGKDLSGWKVPKGSPATWKVENGLLTCEGPESYLFTERDDFDDFHLRVEAKLNDLGDSGLLFRTAFRPGYPGAYEAQITYTSPEIPTGSLVKNSALIGKVQTVAVPPDTWFTQEVIATGDRVIIKINGRVTADVVDPGTSFRSGHVALQHWSKETRVRFRRIEIKQLAAETNCLVVASAGKVLRFNAKTGDFLDAIIAPQAIDFFAPCGVAVRGEAIFIGDHGRPPLFRYGGPGTTVQSLVTNPDLSAGEMTLGLEGDLLVADRRHENRVRRFTLDGTELAPFVADGAGGLAGCRGLAFGPDDNLYVCDQLKSNVLQYDGKSGSFIKVFISSGSGGLNTPHGLCFGPDGNLYVVSARSNAVLRYNGRTGGCIGHFVAPGSGGLRNPHGLAFGPDGNLFVCSRDSDNVVRFNGKTGAFMDAFVPAGYGGLKGPTYLAFQAGRVKMQQVKKAAPVRGLIHHFRFDEGSGGEIQDEVTKVVFGTHNARYSTDVPQLGIENRFSLQLGPTNLATIAAPFIFNAPAREGTLEFWVKPLAIRGHTGLFWTTRPDEPNTNRFNFYMNPDFKMGLDYLKDGKLQTLLNADTFKLAAQKWNHVAVVRSAAIYRFYRNGKLVRRSQDSFKSLPDGVPWLINGRMGCQNADYLLDEVRVWDRAINPNEFLVGSSP